ncbi:MAG: class I SAM-dependent methyltransferase [Rubrivivax sp.]|nr:class I SAM-dependent methyltransferase [Rubrivivax sp.]
MQHEGNLEEFQDPVNYDLEEIPGSEDRIAMIRAAVTAQGSTTLELACGTGVVTLPLAAAGQHATGVDLSRPMLEHARTKAAAMGLDGCTSWHHADARQVRLPGHVASAVLTGNAFQAFLTDADQQALMATVHAHLEPGGLFVFETRNPSGHPLRDITVWEPWFEYRSTEGHRVHVGGTQRWDAATRVLHWTTERRWTDAGTGQPHRRTARIACRFTAPDELAGLLAAAGFAIERQFGDWDGSPLSADSPEIITFCRRAA